MVQSLNARKLEIETALKNAISDKRIIDGKFSMQILTSYIYIFRQIG